MYSNNTYRNIRNTTKAFPTTKIPNILQKYFFILIYIYLTFLFVYKLLWIYSQLFIFNFTNKNTRNLILNIHLGQTKHFFFCGNLKIKTIKKSKIENTNHVKNYNYNNIAQNTCIPIVGTFYFVIV